MNAITKIFESPETQADAVAYLQNVLSNDIKRQLLWMSKDEAGMLWNSELGGQVRNELGLEDSNTKLLTDCMESNANDAVDAILYALWFSLKTER